MTSNELSRLCENCKEISRTWQKHTRMNTQESRSSKLNMLDVGNYLEKGCHLCALIYWIIPLTKLLFLESDLSTHMFRISLTENYNDNKCYSLRVDCGDGPEPVHLCLIPVEDSSIFRSWFPSNELIETRPSSDSYDDKCRFIYGIV